MPNTATMPSESTEADSKQDLQQVTFPSSQVHLALAFNQKINIANRNALNKQVAEINFKRIEEFMPSDTTKPSLKIEPLPQKCILHLARQVNKHEEWSKAGLKAIGQGQLAIITLAGGQGTRLGINGPKGCFCVGNPSGKSLFQLQAEKITRLSQLASKQNNKHDSSQGISWYIMTSDATYDKTIMFFQENSFFGFPKTQVHFFKQANLPCIDSAGNVLMESESTIAVSPNGNGGIFAALNNQSIVTSMREAGIKYVHVCSVDNILFKMGDPLFLGLFIDKNLELACKSVERENPGESVGVFCLKNGKLSVAEYSEIGAEQAALVNNRDGRLLYNQANIISYLFKLDFLETICQKSNDILYPHAAFKKVSFFDFEQKMVVKPTTPNAYKMELFLFDAFCLASNYCIVEVKKEDEFAPLKNSSHSSIDNPECARIKLQNLHLNYLKNAGAVLPSTQCLNSNEKLCEISPLTSYDGEGLENFKGKSISFPFYT